MRYTRFDDHFAEFVDVTSRAKTKAQVLQAFTFAVGSLGYDRVNLCILHDDDLPAEECQPSIGCTYPKAWQDFYADQNLALVDPVVRCAVAGIDAFRWRDIEKRESLTRQQIDVLRLAEEAGLFNGVGIPFPGGNTQVAGVALATSTRSGIEPVNPFVLAAYGNHLYASYKKVVRANTPRIQAGSVLSAKEQRVLKLVADGACDKEVAKRMGIAPHTVNHHFRRIFEKLNTSSRVQAVVIALTHRLFTQDLLI